MLCVLKEQVGEGRVRVQLSRKNAIVDLHGLKK